MSSVEPNWRHLLELALPALDYVFADKILEEKPFWTLGGGTAISIILDHRESDDIDIFVPGIGLKAFTPALNPFSKKISSNFQWPGFYLKFELPTGEIDFLSAALQTAPGYTIWPFGDRDIALETPEEVIIKKIRYRSHAFKARDLYDLAAVSLEVPNLDQIIARETSDALPRLVASIELLKQRGLAAIEAAIRPTHKGKWILPIVFVETSALIKRVHAILNDLPGPTVPAP